MSGETDDARSKGPEIIDPSEVPVVFVDYVITAGDHEGVLNLALGTIDHSRKRTDEELAKVVVAARLRLSLPFASRLYDLLGAAIGEQKRAGSTQTPQGQLN